MRNLFIDWGIGDYYGWGVYGYNLLYWSLLGNRFRPVPLRWPPSLLYPPDPLAKHLFATYEPLLKSGVRSSGGDVLLRGVGNAVQEPSRPDLCEIAVTFFENNPLPPSAIEALRNFPAVIAGSSWNRDMLKEMGIGNAHLVIQGIDTDLFRPLPKRALVDRFVVFSGGKLEFRKGQDLIVKSFSIFAEKHPEALLVNCWRSPWETSIASSINESGLCRELSMSGDVHASICAWLTSNGIKPEQFLCIEATANRLMPEVFREVDVAVFPNRCEGGTNLVAMEALSCGLPCIISRNSGHLDLIRADNCIPLERQRAINKSNMVGWGESDVDEIVAALESAFANPRRLDRDVISRSVRHMSWKGAIESLERCVLSIAGG